MIRNSPLRVKRINCAHLVFETLDFHLKFGSSLLLLLKLILKLLHWMAFGVANCLLVVLMIGVRVTYFGSWQLSLRASHHLSISILLRACVVTVVCLLDSQIRRKDALWNVLSVVCNSDNSDFVDDVRLVFSSLTRFRYGRKESSCMSPIHICGVSSKWTKWSLMSASTVESVSHSV